MTEFYLSCDSFDYCRYCNILWFLLVLLTFSLCLSGLANVAVYRYFAGFEGIDYTPSATRLRAKARAWVILSWVNISIVSWSSSWCTKPHNTKWYFFMFSVALTGSHPHDFVPWAQSLFLFFLVLGNTQNKNSVLMLRTQLMCKWFKNENKNKKLP